MPKSKKLKITCISDTHTKHRELDLPGGDILIHAGDFMGAGRDPTELEDFVSWLASQPYNHKIFIAGNHDRILEEDPESALKIIKGFDVIYLQDSSCTIDGIKFYGSPWTPAFCNWAFQDYGDINYYNNIPEDTDVLITHGPAYGVMDQYVMPTGGLSNNLGSEKLMDWIEENNPKLHICGHIHSGQGVNDGYGEMTTFINASCLGEDYKYSNSKEYFEWTI